MSPISRKKCHICNSTFPDKVIFCSVCGTELVDETRKPPTDIDSPIDLPSGHPNSKSFFRDEPLETKAMDGEFLTDKTPYAWQVSENLVPFRMKNQISYSDGFRSPKLNVKRFQQMSVLEGFTLTSINLLVSMLLILFSSIIVLTTMEIITLSWLPIFLATCSFIGFFGLSYLSYFKTAKTIFEWDEKSLSHTKSTFLSFSFIQTIQLGLASAISIVCMKLFFPGTDSIGSPISIYVPSILIILLVALTSPTFHIAKILTLLRNAGVTQDFLDAFQFPKIGVKRTAQVVVLSYLLPSLLIISIFSPASRLVSLILSAGTEVNIAVWEYVVIGLAILILTFSLTFANLVDVNTFYYYEQSLKTYIEPPSLSWVKKVGSYYSSVNDEGFQDDTEASRAFGLENKDDRCPVCSMVLVKGTEFCTNCGKKIVR